MTVESIAQMTNLVLTILFIAIILFSLLAGFVGFKNGVWRTSSRMVIFVLLVVLAACTLTPTANFLSTFPVDWLGVKTIIITNSNIGVTYYAPVTNLKDTLVSALKGYYQLFNIVGNSSRAAEVAIGTAASVIKLITFAIDMILIVTLGWLFEVILWHAAFKRFIPKLVRRVVRWPWFSMVQNIVTYVASTLLLLSPLTSLVSALNSAYQKHGGSDNQNQYVLYIDSFLDTYNSSLFAKTFLNWTADESGLTIDAQIINALTSTTLDNASVGICDTVYSIGEIGTILSDAISSTDGKISIDYGAIASAEMVEELFDALRGSDLFLVVVPIVAELAMNEQVFTTFMKEFDPRLLNMSEVDWLSEMNNVETMMLDIINSGVLSQFIDEDGHLIKDIKADELIKSCLTAQSFQKVEHLLSTIDNSKLLSRAIPSIISWFASTNESMGKYFPSSWDELNDIRWGSELAGALEGIHDIYLVNPDIINVIFDMTKKPASVPETSPLAPSKANEGEEETPTTKLLKMIISDIDAYKTVFVGETDANNNLLYLDKNGKTTLYENGHRISGRKSCFLDLEISRFVLKPVLSALADTFEKATSDGTNPEVREIDKVISELNSGAWARNYKEEFNSVFYTLSAFKSNPDTVASLVSGKSLIPEGGSISDIDPSLIKSLAKALPSMDKSKILSTLVFPMVEKVITDPNTMTQLEKLGLSTELIDVGIALAKQEKQFGYELSKIVRAVTSMNNVLDALNGATSSEIIANIGDNAEDIAYLLDAFHSCKIINPSRDERVTVGSTNYRINANYYGLMNYIFGDAMTVGGLSFKEEALSSNIVWENSKNDNGEFFRDRHGNAIFTGENGAIANVLKTIADSNIMSILDDSTFFQNNESLAALASPSGYNLPGILKAVNYSQVFAATMGDFLDSTLNSMNLVGVADVTFNNVKDWEEEGEKLATILTSIGKVEFSLSSLNLTAISDVVGLNNLLHALVDSSIFVKKDTGEFLFGKWLFTKLTDGENGLCNLYGSYNIVKDPDHTKTIDIEGVPTTVDTWNEEWENFDNYVLPDAAHDDYRILYNDLCGLSSKNDWYSNSFTSEFNVSQYTSSVYTNYYDNPAFYTAYSPILELDEVGRIINLIFWARKALDGVSSPIDMTSTTFNGLIEAFNDTRCLRIGVYNLYELAKKAINDNPSVKNFFDLSPAYTTYMINCDMGMSLYEESRAARLVEIKYLEDVYFTYRTMITKGIMTIGSSTFESDNIDAEFTEQMKTALKGVNKSLVFHRKGSSLRVEGSDEYYPTAFQNMLSSFYLKTDFKEIIYNVNNPKDVYYSTVEHKYEPNVTSKVNYILDTYFNWEDASNLVGGSSAQLNEIDNIFEALNAVVGGLKPNGIDRYVGLKKFDSVQQKYVTTFSFLNYDIKLDSNIDAVKEILTALNGTQTLYDLVPNSVYMSLTNSEIANQFSSMDRVNFLDANLFYHYFDTLNTHGEAPYNWNAKFTDSNDTEAYGTVNDITFITNLMKQASLYASDNEEQHNSSVITSFENIKTANVAAVNEFLTDMIKSKVFHAAGPRKTIDASGNVILASSTGKTVFQEVMEQFLSTNDIKQSLYNVNNPKDHDYANADEKIDAIVRDVFSYNSSKFGAEEIEINNICDFLLDAQNFGTTNILSVDISDNSLDVDAMISVLESMNKTESLYDCVPNILYNTFSANSFDLFGTGLTLSNVEPYYIYDVGSLDYSRHYPDYEIRNLGDIISTYQQFVDIVGNDSMTDLDTIKVLNEQGVIYKILSKMHASEMFHKYNSRNVVDGRLTVFEEFVYYLVHETGLDEFTYGATDARSRMIANIENVTLLDSDRNSVNSTGYHNEWDAANEKDELHAFVNFIKAGQEFLAGRGTLDFNSFEFGNSSPTKVGTLMKAINGVDFISDALPVFVQHGFNEIGMTALTTYNGVDYAHYDLGQYVYGGMPGVETSCEIDYIQSALSNMYVQDGVDYEYADVSNFTTLATKVDNFNGILEFAQKGHILNTSLDGVYNSMNIVETVKMSARGVFLYNSFNATGSGTHISTYVTGSNAAEKISTLSKIFTFTNGYDYKNEAKGLYALARDSFSIDETILDVSDFGNVCVARNALDRLLTASYNIDGFSSRSYFASEVMSGLLDQIMIRECDKAGIAVPINYGATTIGADTANINETAYINLNANESNGVVKAIDAYKITKGISIGVNPSRSEFVNAINSLDGSTFAKVVFVAEINPLLSTSIDPFASGFTFVSISNTLASSLGLTD